MSSTSSIRSLLCYQPTPTTPSATPTPPPTSVSLLQQVEDLVIILSAESALMIRGRTLQCVSAIFPLFLSVCPQIYVAPVTALNLLLELSPNTVNNTQRLSLLRRAAQGMTAVTTEFVEVITDL